MLITANERPNEMLYEPWLANILFTMKSTVLPLVTSEARIRTELYTPLRPFLKRDQSTSLYRPAIPRNDCTNNAGDIFLRGWTFIQMLFTRDFLVHDRSRSWTHHGNSNREAKDGYVAQSVSRIALFRWRSVEIYLPACGTIRLRTIHFV